MSLYIEFGVIIKLNVFKLNASLIFNKVDMFDFFNRLLDILLLRAHCNLFFGLFVVKLLHMVKHFGVGRV